MTDPIYKTIDDLPSPPSLSVGDKVEISHAGTSYAATVAQLGGQLDGTLSYLPLTGGTLSGPLTGTTADFATSVTTQEVQGPVGGVLRLDAPATIRHQIAGTSVMDMGAASLVPGSDGGVSLGGVSSRWSDVRTMDLHSNAATLTGALTGTTAEFSGPVGCVGTMAQDAQFYITQTDAPADQKNWALDAEAGNIVSVFYSDAWAEQGRQTFGRNGSFTLSGALTGTTATMSGTVAVDRLDITGAGAGNISVLGLYEPTSGVNKYITNSGGDYVLMNSAFSIALFRVTDAGVTTLTGALTGTTAGFSGAITGASISTTGLHTALNATAVGAGANTQAFVKASSTANLGLYYGTGAPSFTAAKGSMYSNTTATTTTTRLYVNTDGGTTWTNLTTAA